MKISNKEGTVFFKNGLKCIIRNKSDSIAFFENFFLKLNTPEKEFEIKLNDIIVDIGAHVGYFTLISTKNASLGKIYSIEPHKESFEILKKNLLLNNITNVNAFNVAITKSTGKIRLYIDKDNQIGNTIIKNKNHNQSEYVDSFSLKDFVSNNKNEKIDFLKIDCEGAEYEILMNASSSDLNKIKKISVEIHEKIVPYSKEVMIEKLEKHGFNIKLQTDISGIRMELPLLLAWK